MDLRARDVLDGWQLAVTLGAVHQQLPYGELTAGLAVLLALHRGHLRQAAATLATATAAELLAAYLGAHS